MLFLPYFFRPLPLSAGALYDFPSGPGMEVVRYGLE